MAEKRSEAVVPYLGLEAENVSQSTNALAGA